MCIRDRLGGELPAPPQFAPDVISRIDDVRSILDQMQLWIQVLDMAITPAMLRLGVQSDLDPEVAEALLRYFARRRDDSGANRDKTDLVATFLFRHPRVAGQWAVSYTHLDVYKRQASERTGTSDSDRISSSAISNGDKGIDPSRP